MMSPAGLLTLANLLVVVVGIVAGWLVLRSSLSKAEKDIKDRVQQTLLDENEILRNRVLRLEAENRRQAKMLSLITTTLKKILNVDLDIEEDVITLRKANGDVSRISTDTV